MKIHLYTLAWNEKRLLTYFLKHYLPIVDQIFYYDNGSDDGSAETVAKTPKCEMIPWDTGGVFTQEALLNLRNHCWKESRGRADWVICVDVDELLYHPDLRWYLTHCGESMPKTVGYQMVCDEFPVEDRPIVELVNQGTVDPAYSKHVVFRPDCIEEIDYGPGCHACRPKGKVVYNPAPALKLLHYKNLGLEYVFRRNAQIDSRQPQSEKDINFGEQYRWPKEDTIEYFETLKKYAFRVV